MFLDSPFCYFLSIILYINQGIFTTKIYPKNPKYLNKEKWQEC